jgi:xanthosine utilization system XapX-like protein
MTSSIEGMATPLDFFLNMPLMFQIATIAAFFWFPAGFIAIRNYLRIGSLDYLIFAGWFFTNSLGFLSGPLYVWHMVEGIEMPPILFFVVMLNSILMYFFQTAHALRVRWQWKDKPAILWIILGVILAIFLVYLILHTLFPDLFQQEIGDYILWIVTFYYALIWTFTYFTIKPIYDDARIKFVIYAWRYVGLVDLFNSIILVTSYTLDFFSIATLAIESFHEFVVTFLMVPLVTVVFLVGILVPEAMIITEAQILRAYKLYQTVRQHNCDPHIVDQDRLLSYMCKVSEEVFPSK